MRHWSSIKYHILFAVSVTHDAYIVSGPTELVRDLLCGDSLNDVLNTPVDPGFYSGVIRVEYVPGSTADEPAFSMEQYQHIQSKLL